MCIRDRPGVDLVVDAHDLPFPDNSLRGIVMTNVLHHLGNAERFFEECSRCLRPGGVVAMIEPWVSTWSKWVYTRLHHEPFDPAASQWEIPESGPLSGANGALPWILFERDRSRFEAAIPELKVREVTPIMPFCYLVSGGVSMRSLMPSITFPLWRFIEAALHPWIRTWAMFARIVLVRGTCQG